MRRQHRDQHLLSQDLKFGAGSIRRLSKILRRAAPQASSSRLQKKTVRTIKILDGLFTVALCDL
jgi:hypothetical protein